MPLAELFANRAEFEQRWAEVDLNLQRYGRLDWRAPAAHTRRAAALGAGRASGSSRRGDLAGGIIVSYVNVDARRRAERAVALQAERTRSILDSVLVGIVTVGPNGIEWMNRSARRMFGGDLADFVEPADLDRRDARARSPAAARRPARRARRAVSKARPRPSSAASGRATGASSGSSAMSWRPGASRAGRS